MRPLNKNTTEPTPEGELDASYDRKLLLVATLEPEGGSDIKRTARNVYRTLDNGTVMLVEHAGSAAVRVGPTVPRDLPGHQAADILMRDQVGVDTTTFVLALGLVDANIEIARLEDRLKAMQERAVRAEQEARNSGFTAHATPPAVDRQQGVLL